MKKILIISFYELKDYLLYIKDIFEKYYFTIINYPLFRYAYDTNDKIEHYKEHMNKYISDNNPDIILWWFIDVPVYIFEYIKQNNPNKTFIMYNSDDPLNINKDLFNKAKIFDIIITPCYDTINMYKIYSNTKIVLFGLFGYDPNIFKPINNIDQINDYNKYNCDISILSYNTVNDKSIIENIIKYCNNNKLKIKLFGTPLFNNIFPQQYCGDISYNDIPILYNFSKINIINNSYDNIFYINNQSLQILGCNGLLMHYKTKNIEKFLKNNYNCVLYDDTDYLTKIDYILKNYNYYSAIKNNGYKFSKNYTWDIWVENIIREIGKIYFNPHIYTCLYNIDNNFNLLDYWCNKGIKNKEICFDFEIPKSFDAESYIHKNNIKHNHKFAYLHWFINSKKKEELNINNNIDEKYIIIINNILDKITKYNKKENGIRELSKYCHKNTNININNIINNYIKSKFN